MKYLFVLAILVFGMLYANGDLPPVTRDPSNQRLIYYHDYIKEHPPSELHVSKIYADRIDSSPNDVLVIVEERLYNSLSAVLDVYKDDLQDEGFKVTIITADGGTPEALKQVIINNDPAYVFMVGNLPIAWYEMDEFFDGKSDYTNFPIDLFYMDLNGTWADTDTNGMYDNHSGALEADISFGRISADKMTLPWEGNEQPTESEILINWFNKVHNYRKLPPRYDFESLVWIDDDWQYWGNEWSNDVGKAYKTRTTVYDTSQTTKTDYVSRIRASSNNKYEHLLFCCHSGPNGHAITYRGAYQWLYNRELKDIVPQIAFYNLFCCSIARYTESNYMAGWYAMQKTYGLLSIGSTKTGAMLEFNDFYTPLGEGKTFGESFKIWAIENMESGAGSQHESQSWFYGMTIIGDPTLKIAEHQNNFTGRMISSKVPFRFTLSVNPNPVRTEAVFKFNIRKPGLTEVNVYNILGKLVHRETINTRNSGLQNRIFKTGNMNPGRYQVLIKLDGEVLGSKGFIVLK